MRSRWLFLIGVLAAAGCQDRKADELNQPAPQPPVAQEPPGTTRAPGPAVTGPLQGAIAGKPFVPDKIVLEGRSLSFRKGKEFFPEMEIKFDLPEGKLEGKEWKFEGDKFENPTVLVSGKDSQPQFNWPKDYSLALKVTKETSKSVEGTIDLKANLPANTHLRGTFAADRKKTGNDPLDAEDAPYVHGTIAFVGPWTKENLAVGFVGKGTGGKEHSNMIGTEVSAKSGGSATSTTFDPQLTSFTCDDKGHISYRHTRMPPGDYLVYARRNGVLATWREVSVKAGDQQAVDLTIDPAKTGELVVTLPEAEANDQVEWKLSLRPASLPIDVGTFHFAFDAAAVKKGQKSVTVKGVPVGKYLVTRGKSKGEVEVTAGKTAEVTLVRDEPKKK
jgi:hypothetical protein